MAVINFRLLSLILGLSLSALPPSFALAADDKGAADYLAGLALEYRAEAEADLPGAFIHYQAAAAKGSREALLALARLSEPGGGLGQSPEQWRDRLLAAARAGWVEAAYSLALALEQGRVQGAGLNPGEFYYQAALAGHAQAAWRLGELYLAGQDEAQAGLWLALAAENHEPGAALSLGRLYQAEDPTTARRWLEKAEGAEASYLLGELYLREKRFVEAVGAFTAAADQNYPQAHQALGLINQDNDFGRRPNPREALKHFKAAAQAGLPEAGYQLAHMYLAGQATPKDSITGAFWLRRAADAGHQKAGEEYEKLTYTFSVGQKKRLERMIEEGRTPTAKDPVASRAD